MAQVPQDGARLWLPNTYPGFAQDKRPDQKWLRKANTHTDTYNHVPMRRMGTRGRAGRGAQGWGWGENDEDSVEDSAFDGLIFDTVVTFCRRRPSTSSRIRLLTA